MAERSHAQQADQALSRTSLPRASLLCRASVLAWLLTGCATYSEKLADARQLASSGAYEQAVDVVNDVMDVDASDELPDEWDSEESVATLERAMLMQASGAWALSARDLSAAETELEYLEIDLDAIGTLGKVIYSDAAGVYHASPIERLSINAFNMLNYLALESLSGAAVEARRYQVMWDYLETLDELPRPGFGAYLAGFVFEQMGEVDRALRYYEEALEAGELASLDGAIARLAARGGFRGPRIDAVLERVGEPDGRPERGAELLVVVSPGRVPYKVPERMPLGLAIGLASTWVTGDTDILERSALKVVVYPELAQGSEVVRSAQVAIDGEPVPVDLVSDLGEAVRREHEQLKPRIIAAALTRLIARAAVAEGARAAVGASGGNELWRLLAALVAEGALLTLDEPDTRSWTFLPNRVYVARERLPAGSHRVQVEISGLPAHHEVPLTLEDGDFAVVVVTEPR